MSTNLFAYGTLLIPSVFEIVTGRTFEAVDAMLDGYSRYTLSGKVYPGIIQDSDGMVDGRVYCALDDEALKRLTYFEDDLYAATEVSVTLDNRKSLPAIAYVVPPGKSDSITAQPWNMKRFKDEHFDAYLKNVRSFMQKYR